MLYELFITITFLYTIFQTGTFASSNLLDSVSDLYRKAVYQIPTEDESPMESVALALQRVFYHLQTSDLPVRESTSLGSHEISYLIIPNSYDGAHEILWMEIVRFIPATRRPGIQPRPSGQAGVKNEGQSRLLWRSMLCRLSKPL